MTASPPRDRRSSPRRRRAGGVDANLLRYLPVDSPVHRLWAGSKILAVLGAGIGLAVNPGWAAQGILAGVLLLALLVARIPWSARPRLPVWFWAAIGIGGLIALASGGPPNVGVAGFTLGMGSLATWAQFTVLAALALLTAALVAWTTPMAELAPALARLLAPVRGLRWGRAQGREGPAPGREAPSSGREGLASGRRGRHRRGGQGSRGLGRVAVAADEMVIVVALSVRCLDLLMQELRTLLAARRSRRTGRPRGWKEVFDEAVDLLVTTLVVATRRAAEMAEAMEARGGWARPVPLGPAPRARDGLALAVVVATVVAMILV